MAGDLRPAPAMLLIQDQQPLIFRWGPLLLLDVWVDLQCKPSPHIKTTCSTKCSGELLTMVKQRSKIVMTSGVASCTPRNVCQCSGKSCIELKQSLWIPFRVQGVGVQEPAASMQIVGKQRGMCFSSSLLTSQWRAFCSVKRCQLVCMPEQAAFAQHGAYTTALCYATMAAKECAWQGTLLCKS